MEEKGGKKITKFWNIAKIFWWKLRKKILKKISTFQKVFFPWFFLKEQQGVEKGRKECKWNLFIFRASKMFNLRVSPLDSWIMEALVELLKKSRCIPSTKMWRGLKLALYPQRTNIWKVSNDHSTLNFLRNTLLHTNLQSFEMFIY